MALTQQEILSTLAKLSSLGDEARALAEEIKTSREDGEVTPEERKRRQKAAKALARKASPIALQFALDVLD